MAMTAAVKDELSRVDVPKPCCRRAEMAALLRFAGGLHIVSGRVVVEAELDTGAVARRLRREIADVYGYPSEVHVLASGGLRKGSHYIVRIVKDGEALARQTGLLDVRGRPVRGLPPHVVSANVCCAVAAWRGAFMAHGSLTEPGRSSALEITCPGPEAALALRGAARRIGITAKEREVRGVDRVVIKDGDAIAALLTRIGAHASVLAWEERRVRREVRATANRLANFDDANLRRSARAAVAAAARVTRAAAATAARAERRRLASSKLARRFAVARTSRRTRRSSQASTLAWAPIRVSRAAIASPSLITTRSTPRTSRSLAVMPMRRAAPRSASAASGPGQVISRALERPGSVSDPWAMNAPRQAATAQQTLAETTCGGSPRTGRPRTSSRPVCRARASPSLTMRTM